MVSLPHRTLGARPTTASVGDEKRRRATLGPLVLCGRSTLDGYPQERGRDAGGSLALILTVEELLELLLQSGSAAGLLRRVERIHGRAVVSAEYVQESGRCAGEVEGERIAYER